MIKFIDVTVKHKKDYNTLQNINLKINKGDKVAIVGDEYSGKDTLARLISKEELTTSGKVLVNNLNVLDVNYKTDISLGYLKKMPVFFNNKTVRQNLNYVLKLRGVSLSEIDATVLNALKLFNMLDIAEIKIKKLSLYEKMVVAIIRLSLRQLDVLVLEDYASLKVFEIYRRKGVSFKKNHAKNKQKDNKNVSLENVFEDYEVENLNDKINILLNIQKQATVLLTCEKSSELLKNNSFKVVKLKYGVTEN